MTIDNLVGKVIMDSVFNPIYYCVNRAVELPLWFVINNKLNNSVANTINDSIVNVVRIHLQKYFK